MTVEPPVPVAAGRGDPGTDGSVAVASGSVAASRSGSHRRIPQRSARRRRPRTTADGPGVPMIAQHVAGRRRRPDRDRKEDDRGDPRGRGGRVAEQAVPGHGTAVAARGKRCTGPHREPRDRRQAWTPARGRRGAVREAALGATGAAIDAVWPARHGASPVALVRALAIGWRTAPADPDPVGHLARPRAGRVRDPVDRAIATCPPPTHDPQQHGRRHHADQRRAATNPGSSRGDASTRGGAVRRGQVRSAGVGSAVGSASYASASSSSGRPKSPRVGRNRTSPDATKTPRNAYSCVAPDRTARAPPGPRRSRRSAAPSGGATGPGRAADGGCAAVRAERRAPLRQPPDDDPERVDDRHAEDEQRHGDLGRAEDRQHGQRVARRT